MIIDVFNHFYPKEYLEALRKPLPNEVTYVYSTLRGITDLQYRLSLMDKYGVDMQILSIQPSGRGSQQWCFLRFSLALNICFLAPTSHGDTPRIINIKGLSIPEEEKRMILGENAMKLFKLE